MNRRPERTWSYLRFWYQCRAGWLLLAIAIPLLVSVLFMPVRNARDAGSLFGMLLLCALLAGFHKGSVLLEILRMKL
jgi:hypothetical protein